MPDQPVPDLSAIPASGGSVILWFFFIVVLIMTVYYVFAELYHWLRWGYMYPLVWLAMPVYLIGIVVLLGAMLTGIATA